MSASRREWAARMRRHRVALALGAVVLLVVVVLVVRRRGAGEGDEEEVAAVVTAPVGTARVEPFEVTIAAIGPVQARPGHAAQVAAPAASRVARVLVAVGDRVRPGQALVALDETVWAAQTHQAEVALTAAQQAYDRAERLVNEGISPRKDVEAAAADLARARADLETARRTQALGTLRSPIAGVVTAVNAAVAQPVDANAPLVEVVDPSSLEVLFHLSPPDAARVEAGDPVHLTSVRDSLAVDLGSGTVSGVSAAVDSTGSVAVRASVARPTRPLKVGETVSGRIVVATHPRSVVVPVSALVPSDDATQVFVVDAKNVAHATPVTVGARNETNAEVLSGLSGGERIVLEGSYGVTDGATIRPQAAASPQETSP